MSYKYLYAYTDELSLDLSYAKYIGKQDRANPELIRATEHISKQDKQRVEFSNTKYLLVTVVPNGESTSDYEAYLIQKYNPPLNRVYTNKRLTKKLDDEEFKEIEKKVDKLDWYLIENVTYRTIDPQSKIKIINYNQQILEAASYVFKDEEEFNNATLNEIKEKLSKGRVFIEPKLRASDVVELFEITEAKDNDCLLIKNLGPGKSERNVEYSYTMGRAIVPELEITIENLRYSERDKASEKFQKVKYPYTGHIFYLWALLLIKAISQLQAVEPDFVHNVKIEDLDKSLHELSLIGEGFNYRNLKEVAQVKDICSHEEATDRWTGWDVHLKSLLGDDEDYAFIRTATLEEFYAENYMEENNLKDCLKEEMSFVFNDTYYYSNLIYS